MYDTIAAILPCPAGLQPGMFSGGSMTIRLGTEEPSERWRYWRNPEVDGPYEPRMTLWPSSEDDHEGGELPNGWLKCEFSLQRMYIQELHNEHGLVDDTVYLDNMTQAQAMRGLRAVDEYLRSNFGMMPSIHTWKCQRIDYAWNFEVGKLLPVYLSVVEHLRLSNYSRHPFDAAEGVVFKGRGARSRWVKFYNKVRQLVALLGTKVSPDEHVLRFEMSNYKDATRYMADKWFGCDRAVGEMVHPGRCLYALAKMWEMLSLTKSEGYGRSEYELFRIAEAFTTRRRGTAYYVLHSWRVLGLDAYKLGHVTKSTYYRLMRELKELGFLASVSDDVDEREALPALHLAFDEYMKQLEDAYNLGFSGSILGAIQPENFAENTTWEQVAHVLCVVGPKLDYLVGLADAYLGRTSKQGSRILGPGARSERVFTGPYVGTRDLWRGQSGGSSSAVAAG